jgi:Fe-S cluster assembly iron-binding protein IscA
MKDGLEVTAGFLNDEHTEAVEYEILALEKDIISKKRLTGPERIDLSFSLPILISHLIWIVNFGSDSFWPYNILNFFILITTAYFLLLHLRSEILLWNQKYSFSKTLLQLNELSSVFKKSDGLISRSLRLVRDITVIANGHVTVNSRKSIKAHDGATKLKEAIFEFISSLIRIVGDKCEMRNDEDLLNKFELGILFYQQSRSTCLHNMLVNETQHSILNFELIMKNTKSSIHKLETTLEITRKGTDFQNKSSENKKSNFEQITKQSLFRSLSLHGRQLAEYAFQAENANTTNLQSEPIEIHVRSIMQNYQLLVDFDKQKNTVSTQVQSKSQTVTVPSQTNPSLEAISLDFVREDIRGDEVLECVIDKKIDQTESTVLAEYDEVDQHTKQASSVVFTELKSILHKEVNPEKRQKRKEELFPEFWSKEPRRAEPNYDVIIPDASLFSLSQSEAMSNSTNSESDGGAIIQKPNVYLCSPLV